MAKRVAILGVTGFIGRGLAGNFADAGWEVTGISRAGSGSIRGVSRWQRSDALDLAGHDAVINLAGEPIDQRWTPANRRLFRESRVDVSRHWGEHLANLPEAERPRVWVNGTAVGYYGDRGDEMLTECSAPGTGYLADLCVDWEHAARESVPAGVRLVVLRTGVVIGHGGAAYEKLRRVFGLGLGGRIASGRQWMPWIHVDDLRASIVHAVVTENLTGPVNGVAPHPERNAAFTQKFAAALHRPALFPVPAFALRLALGEFASAVIASQRVLPTALQESGFQFRYPTLESALEELVSAR